MRDEFWYAARFGLDWPKLVPGPKVKPSIFDLEQPLQVISPTPCPGCEICWANGTKITETNRNVLPGHEINLKVQCDGNPSITNVSWTVEGSVFLSFETPESHSTLNPADLKQNPVTFHWADVGEDRTVSVKFKANGNWCSAETTFNVKDPLVEFPYEGGIYFDPPPIGLPAKDDMLPGITLKNAYAGESSGIVFKAKGHIPGAFYFAEGDWYFGQLTCATIIRKKTTTETCAIRTTNITTADTFVNDDRWPCLNPNGWPDPPFPTGNTDGAVPDSPDTPYRDSDQIKRTSKFRIYLMFRPAPDPPGAGPSQYVPLRRCEWYCNWCGGNDRRCMEH